MPVYTINLSVAEDLALSYEAASQQEWIENFIKFRCRDAMDKIVKIAVDQCFANNIPVPSTKDETIILAFEKGWVLSGKQSNEQAQQLLLRDI